MLDRFVVALVGGSHGLEGHCKVRSLSGEVEHLEQLREVVLRKDGVEKRWKIEEAYASGANFFMKFGGIDTPEAAKALSGSELVVSREQAAPLAEGEFYIEDLRGSALVHNGETVGEVLGIIEGGGGQLVEVKTAEGVKLIPFRDEFIGTVDPAARRMELRVTWILE